VYPGDRSLLSTAIRIPNAHNSPPAPLQNKKIKTTSNNILSLASDSVSALLIFACTLRLRSSYYGKMKWIMHVAYMGEK